LRRVRVGFLTPSLYWGGAERWMLDLARHSRRDLDWVGCAVMHPINNDETMVGLFGELMPVRCYGMEAARRVAAEADVVLSWGDCSAVGQLGVPIVWVGHGVGLFDRAAIRDASRWATHFACVSEAGRDIFEGYVPAELVTVMHNGIDPSRCEPTETRDQTRASLGLSDEFLVGYLGRMVPEKAPIRIAEAVATLPAWCRACFVGGGWDLGRQRATIAHVLGHRAVHVDRTERIGDYLRAFDCFCLASPAEGFSMGMLEAMWCGVPCVLTRVGVLPELERRHGRHRWVSLDPRCSREELADAIRSVADLGPSGRAAMARSARKIVESRYLAGHMAARWVTYLTKVASLTLA